MYLDTAILAYMVQNFALTRKILAEKLWGVALNGELELESMAKKARRAAQVKKADRAASSADASLQKLQVCQKL